VDTGTFATATAEIELLVLNGGQEIRVDCHNGVNQISASA
jgi:hypothetical protein